MQWRLSTSCESKGQSFSTNKDPPDPDVESEAIPSFEFNALANIVDYNYKLIPYLTKAKNPFMGLPYKSTEIKLETGKNSCNSCFELADGNYYSSFDGNAGSVGDYFWNVLAAGWSGRSEVPASASVSEPEPEPDWAADPLIGIMSVEALNEMRRACLVPGPRQHLVKSSVKNQFFLCKVCHVLFRNAYRYRKHSREHTGFMDLTCENCGLRFNERYLLRRHQSKNMGSKKGSSIKELICTPSSHRPRRGRRFNEQNL